MRDHFEVMVIQSRAVWHLSKAPKAIPDSSLKNNT